MNVGIVTPTIGSDVFWKCVDSVQKQTFNDIIHYVIVDGHEYTDDVYRIIDTFSGSKKIYPIYLTENIGKGWYGHRAYSACSFLVNTDIICYLDEDNWLDEDHVENIVKVIETGKQWAYSLRKIHDKNGNYICEDNCESLGKWSVYFDPDIFHIDTSCYGVRRDVAVKIGHSWYGQWGADRQFFHNLKKYFPEFECTYRYSLNYRLDGNTNSVNKEFFETGNNENLKKYGTFPWKKGE